MKTLYNYTRKILTTSQTISVKISINYAYLNVVFMIYTVGFYGFPAITIEFNSTSGMIFRIFQLTLIFLAFLGWFIFILKQPENNRNESHKNTINISLNNLLGTLLIFTTIAISRQRELSSSITGDEIAYYDKTISISKHLMQLIISNISAVQIIPARIVIGISQIILICIFLFLIKFLLKFESKNKLYILFTIVIFMYFTRNYYMGGSNLYPDTETLPYFITSPFLLITNVSPKYIAVAMLSVFLQIIYQLSKDTIKQQSLRVTLITILLSLNILTDIATTLNHGIFYIYIFTIFLIIFDREKYVSRQIVLSLLTFSIYRPTVLIILPFLLAHVAYRYRSYRKLKYLVSGNMNKIKIFMPQYAVLFILVLTNLAYARTDSTVKPSINDNLGLWVKNFSNFDLQTTFYIIIGSTFLIGSKRYSILLLFFLSFVFYWLTAPRGNLSNPIYKVEIITPFLIFTVTIILTRVSELLSKIQFNRNQFYRATGPIALVLCLLVAQMFKSNYSSTKFPNYSWNPEYNSVQSKFKIRSDTSSHPQYISFAKIDYNLEALNITLQNSCKFLDIIYSGSFLLKTNISAKEFLVVTKDLSVDYLSLVMNPSINCVFVGNYPYEKFEESNRRLNLKFRLSKAYFSDELGTVLRMYVRDGR
jgi:hypothetical protein